MKYIVPVILLTIIAALGGWFYLDQNNQETIPKDTQTVSQAEPTQPSEELSTPGEKPIEAEVKQPDSEEQKEGDSIAITELETPEGDGFPIETNHFSIEQVTESEFNMTLFAIINRPEQYQEYQNQLKQFKEEALKYMQENNIDTESVTITYSPNEAADL